MSWIPDRSVIAILISLVAVVFTGLQWYDAHHQLLLSMKPSVNFMNQNDSDELPVGISIENAGPGPAQIKSISYFVDKKPVGDVDKAIEQTGLEEIQFLELEEGDTLAVGGKEQWLLKMSKKPHGKEEQKELDHFIDVISHHLAIEVEFCPVVSGGNCGKKCSTKGWCQ